MASNAVDCNANPMCQATGSGSGCVSRCQTRHTTPAPCNADPQCFWVASSRTCQGTCSKTSTVDQCRANTLCMWVDEKCKAGCSLRNANVSQCAADNECVWDAKNQQCVTDCTDIVSQAQCEAQRAVCAWDQQYQSCSTLCAIKYPAAANSSASAADPQCGWNNATRTCEKGCTTLTSQSYCIAQASCQWDAAGGRCAPACDAYTNDGACVASGLCQFDRGGSGCTTACELRHTEKVGCASDPQCLWDGRSATCRTACSTIASTQTCEASPVCEVTSTGTCVKQCGVANPSQDSCARDPNCQWDASRLRCFTKCSAVVATASATCTRNPECQFDTKSSSCTTACGALASCSAAAGCVINDLGNCVRDCGGLGMSACQELSACLWSAASSTCQSSCKESFAKRPTECATSANCQWDASTGSCGTACTLLNGTLDCAQQGVCMLVRQTCKTTCAVAYSTAAACQGDKDCLWDATRQECRRTCTSINDATACQSNDDCKWVGQLQTCRRACELLSQADCQANTECQVQPDGTCMPTYAYRYAVRESCNNDPDCEWFTKAGGCGTRLCLTPSQVACVADARCQWNETLFMCVHAPCQWGDAVTCALYRECEWFTGNQTCIGKICPNLPRFQCNNRSGWCQYNTTTQTCDKQCRMYGAKDECQAARCDWTFQGTCALPCSDSYSTQRDCSSDNNCQYDVTTGGCVSACSKAASLADCVGNPLCLWAQGTCKVRCDRKYVAAELALCADDQSCELIDLPSGLKQCIEPCRRQNASACPTTPGCRIEPTTGTCVTSCTGKYATKDTCLGDSTCMWSGSPRANCRQDCESLTDQTSCGLEKSRTSAGTTVDTCTWSNGKCTTPCQYKYASLETCTGNANCVWDTTGSTPRCIAACSTYDSSACPGVVCTIDPVTSKCTRSCQAAYGSNAAQCGADASCEWNFREGTCGPKMCTGASQSVCEQVASDNCTWNAATSTCLGPCWNLPTSDSCAAQGGRCTWLADSSRCVTLCSAVTDMSKCTGTCFVVDSVCQQVCDTVSSEVACNELPACAYDSGTRTCKIGCQWRYGPSDLVDCAADSTCVVRNGACAPRKCSYATLASCNNDPQCDWNAAAGSCGARNCSYTTQDACAAAKCSWTATPTGASCGPAICDPMASASACAANRACVYQGGSCGTKEC
ncbi:MAG: hypothetical protein ACK53C_17520, partial [Pseudomonadota bacterium]